MMEENGCSGVETQVKRDPENVDNNRVGYYIVRENPDDQFDIKVEINPESGISPTEEQKRLYKEQEIACTIIKSLNSTDKEVKRIYFSKLLSLTQAGLVGKNPKTNLALDAIECLREEIVIIEGKRIKNKYMARLGAYAACGLFILFLLYLLFTYCVFTEIFRAVTLVGMGSMIGAWVSFGARKYEIRFEELAVIEKDMMEPVIRLMFVFVAAIILFFFMISGIIELKIGTLNTINSLKDYRVPLVIGIVCGLVESRVGVRVYKQANNILGE